MPFPCSEGTAFVHCSFNATAYGQEQMQWTSGGMTGPVLAGLGEDVNMRLPDTIKLKEYSHVPQIRILIDLGVLGGREQTDEDRTTREEFDFFMKTGEELMKVHNLRGDLNDIQKKALIEYMKAQFHRRLRDWNNERDARRFAQLEQPFTPEMMRAQFNRELQQRQQSYESAKPYRYGMCSFTPPPFTFNWDWVGYYFQSPGTAVLKIHWQTRDGRDLCKDELDSLVWEVSKVQRILFVGTVDFGSPAGDGHKYQAFAGNAFQQYVPVLNLTVPVPHGGRHRRSE